MFGVQCHLAAKIRETFSAVCTDRMVALVARIYLNRCHRLHRWA